MLVVLLKLDDAEMAKQSCQAVLQSANKKEKATQIVVCKETVSPGQDSCWSWVVCFAAVFSNVVICGFTYSYGILFPALLDEFQQGKANTAWIGSIAMAGVGLYGPIIGKVYHRFGARTVAFLGSIICVISLIATSQAPNLYVMLATYGVLFGFGSCSVYMITFMAVPRYFVRWRSLSLGLIAMGPGGGLFIMSPIVQALFERFGWRGTFLAMAGVVSLACVMAFVYRPITLESDKVELHSDSKTDNKFWDFSIVKHKKFMLCVTAGVVFYLGHYTPTVHMVRFLEDRGSSEVKASRLYIYSGIASLLVRPVIGRVNDLTWVNPCYIYTVAAALEGVFTILLPFASAQFHFVIYFVFYGLADGTVGCGINIAILNGLPERLKPLGFGIYNCLSCITSACGPALGGLVADISGSYVPVFHMVGAIMLVGAALLLAVSCIKNPDKLRTEQETDLWEMLLVVEKCSVV